jgi:hypothetical protein
MVLEPSVSEDEWLSRDLARAVRDDELAPEETGRFLKLYGLEPAGTNVEPSETETAQEGATETDSVAGRRLVEPMYVTRTGGDLPTYDLRDVDETLVERVTEDEFGA